MLAEVLTRHPPRRHAHSLVEILIVMAIIAIVAALICGVFAKVYRVIESWK